MSNEARGNFKFIYPGEFVPSKRIESNLEHGATDIHFSWAKTAEREKTVKFGEELYKVSYLGVMRQDDKVDFKSISDLIKLGDRGIVLGVFGVASSTNLMKINGLRVDDTGKDVEQNLAKLAAGRGRVFIYQNPAIAYELQRPENKNKFKVVKIDFEDNASFKDAAQYVAFSRKVPAEIIQKINGAIVKSKKEIDAIAKKFTEL